MKRNVADYGTGIRNLRISALGRALADPSRAEILLVLSSGKARTAGQLATHVGLAASTTSRHLAELVDAHLLTVEASGRHRYFRVRSPDIVDLLNMIDKMDLPLPPPLVAKRTAKSTGARTCYDHLAGAAGVALFRSIVDGLLLETPDDDEPRLTSAGHRAFQQLGIDTEWLDAQRRPLVRACLDAEQQAHHLGGALGGALFSLMLARGWLERRPDRRVVVVTRLGQRQIKQTFGLQIAL